MQAKTQQQIGEKITAIDSPAPESLESPCLTTVKLFARENEVFTEPALRNLIFNAETRQSTKGEIPGNGLIECGAILRLGRKVLIDPPRFFIWIRQKNRRD
jgi:hypothetical protein